MKKAIKILLAVLFAVGFAVYLISEISKQPINSDGACMLLEAKDVLSGNILLSDWHLTGVSFITTDLPWFVVSVAVFGVSLRAYHLACFLMYAFMVLCALPLVFYRVSDRLTAFFALLGSGLVPTTYALSHSFVHTSVFGLSFLAVYLVIRFNDTGKRSFLVLFSIVTCLACCGDRTALLLIVLPAVLLAIIGKIKRSAGVFAVLSCVFGMAFEKLYCLIGGADWNDYYTSYFSEISEIPRNIGLYIEYVLRLINSCFFGKDLFSVKTAVFAVKILVCAFALFLLGREIKKLIKNKDFDIPSVMLGMGFITMTAVLWLTTYTTDITTGRYIAFLPMMLAISVARNFKPTGFLRIISAALGIMLFASSVMPHGSPYSAENSFSRLSSYLERENLTEGYAAFWDSSVLSAYSGGKLSVRAIKYEDGRLSPRVWFCKNSWYDEPASFIIVRNSPSPEEDTYRYNGIFTTRLGYGFDYGITEENVKSVLGEPRETRSFENYSILIYDKIPLYKEELWKN